MIVLVDSHVALWWLAGDPIGEAASGALADPDNTALVSAASVWEIAIKQALGKLTIAAGVDLSGALREAGFDELPVTWEHALAAGALPPHHRDPFDRMLAAQALSGSLPLLTRDRVFERYGVRVLAA